MVVFRRRREGGPAGGRRGGAGPAGEAEAMIGMGLTHLKRGDRDEALRWFKQASRTDDPMLLCDLGRIYLFLGDGTGSYVAAPPYPLAAKPSHLAVADLNGDGRADLVEASLAGSQIVILTNTTVP